MNDARLRAECDRVLIAMIEMLESKVEEFPNLGQVKVSGQLYVAKQAVQYDNVATFRKIHIMGELNSLILGLFGDVMIETDWYDHVPYYRETELVFEERE